MLKGVVKSVLSGDCLVVMDNSVKNRAPPEKRLIISGITAPRLASVKNPVDEDFAWEARELLRSSTIGKVVEFQILRVASTEGQSDRTFAKVVADGKDMAEALVEAGVVKPKKGEEELELLEQAAIAAKVGMHANPPNPLRRRLVSDREEGFDIEKFFEKNKGKSLPVQVDMVFSAASMRLVFLPQDSANTFHNIGVSLTGIRAPSLRSKENKDKPEPFAMEGKFFTESRILHREATARLEALDTLPSGQKQIQASVSVPQGNITEALVRHGFATVWSWTLAKSQDSVAIRKAETLAKEQKLRMWRNYTPTQTSKFQGTVVEVVTPDSLVVLDAHDTEHRVFLSSVRTPRLKINDGQLDPIAHAARDLLRKKAVGKLVTVVVEYERNMDEMQAGQDDKDKKDNKKKDNKKKPQQQQGAVRRYGTVKVKELNLAELLCGEGLATVVRHRQNEARSGEYELLIAAQDQAEQNKKGANGKLAKAPPIRSNDLSGDANRARAFLGTFQRTQRVKAMVEFVMNGARFKLLVPKEGCVAPFALSGVRCPRTERPGQPGEPYGDEALRFSRLAVLQRDVEVEFESCDRGGTFLGQMFTANGKSLAVELLEAGLAEMNMVTAEGSRSFSDLKRAEQQARLSNLGIWQDYAEPDPEEDARREREELEKRRKGEHLDAVVTDVTDGSSFHLRPHNAVSLEGKVGEFVSRNSSPPPNWQVTRGAVVCAQFSADQQWYRAQVKRINAREKKAEICFVDFGNLDVVPLNSLLPLPADLAAPQPQAQPAKLAFVKVPSIEEDFGQDAGEAFSQLAMGRRFVVKIEDRDSGVLEVSLVNSDNNENVAVVLLKHGLARVKRKLPRWVSQDAIAELKRAEDSARHAHLGMWEYGDVPDSDDENIDIGGMRIRK